MNCPKCGEDLNNDAKYCNACGCIIEQHEKDVLASTKVFTGAGKEDESFRVRPTNLNVGKKQAKKQKKKGRLVSLLITVAMLLILALAGIFVYQRVYEKPYERAVGKMLKLFNDRSTNMDEYLKVLFPDKIHKDVNAIIKADCEETGKSYATAKADINKQLDIVMETYEDQWGEDFKFEYDIQNVRKLNDDELADIKRSYKSASQLINLFSESGESLKDQGKIEAYEAYNKLVEDFSSMEFDEGYELEVEITMENSDSDKDLEGTNKIYVVKTGDKWMIDFMHYLNALSDLKLFN